MTLERFADYYGLTMVVRERGADRVRGVSRYYACLAGVELMRDGMLCSAFGDGDTPEEAIGEHVKRIAGSRIAIGAHTAERRNIDVPTDLKVEEL